MSEKDVKDNETEALNNDAAENADIEAGDPDLLRRYAHGDQGAAFVLTARHAPRVFALARRLLDIIRIEISFNCFFADHVR